MERAIAQRLSVGLRFGLGRGLVAENSCGSEARMNDVVGYGSGWMLGRVRRDTADLRAVRSAVRCITIALPGVPMV